MIDAAIAKYRAKLAAAGVRVADLDELADHLRELIDELCASGLAPAAAVAEATRRLGEPERIAREHVRVRSEFGPKLSRLRAWSAAALFVAGFAPVIYSLITYGPFGASSITDLTGRQLFVLAAGLAPWAYLVIALVRRAPWAPAVALGTVLPVLVGLCTSGRVVPTTSDPIGFVLDLLSNVSTPALALLVLPWRRAEITPRGAAATLFTLSIFACLSFDSVPRSELFQLYRSDAIEAMDFTTFFTFICVASSGLRAPWLTFVGSCAVTTGLLTIAALSNATGVSPSTHAAATGVTLMLATATALSWYASHRRDRAARLARG